MTDVSVRIPKHPIWPTALILMVSALIGVVFGWMLTLVGAAAALSQAHPIYAVVYGPTILATSSLVLLGVVVVSPFWTLGVGHLCARMYSGKGGFAAQCFGVTFFSEGHPIAQATRRMSDTLGIPPVAYVGWYDAPDINAFAMGTDPRNALVAVSRGAVETLTVEQLDAIIAHELGHVANNDMARATYARGIQQSLTFFLLFYGFKVIARWLFTPLSELEILRFSRAREFTADAASARLTSPEAMISVLEALQAQERRPVTRGYGAAMMSGGFGAGWFSTHPPLERRIAALKAVDALPAPDPIQRADQTLGARVDAERIKANLATVYDTLSSRQKMMAVLARPRSSRWIVGVTATTIWIALAMVVSSDHFSFASAVLVFLLSGFFADMLTALVHFGLGHVASSSTSVLGPIARQVRTHRNMPTLDPSHYMANLTKGALAALPLCVLSMWLGTMGEGYGLFLLSSTVCGMSAWMLFCHQIHAYAHMGAHLHPDAFHEEVARIAELEDRNEQLRQFDRLFDSVPIPKFIRRLQKARILLNPAVHGRQHTRIDAGFSIINGWSDPLTEPMFRKIAQRFKADQFVS